MATRRMKTRSDIFSCSGSAMSTFCGKLRRVLKFPRSLHGGVNLSSQSQLKIF
jgi:hypothetical protein